MPRLFEGKTSADQVRAWVVGCATGEEAYSLAILMLEYAERLPSPPKIQIFATDIDDIALTEARACRYPHAIAIDVSADRLRKYFTADGDFYRVRKEVRELILFAPHNVLRDPPLSRLDLVSCRNLLIYLNRDAQEHVLATFHFSMLPRGYLFLGASESERKRALLVSRHGPEASYFYPPIADRSAPNSPVPLDLPAPFRARL